MLRKDDYINMLEKRANNARTAVHEGLAAANRSKVLRGVGTQVGGVLAGTAIGTGITHHHLMKEKKASDFDGGKIGPSYDHDVDSQAVANSEHRKNLTDNRATLGTMFTNMGEAQKVETRFANKWFPSDKYEKDTSSPLLKVAMVTLSASETFRNYPAHYKAAALRSFTEELQKITE